MFSSRLQQRARQLVMILIKPLARLGITPNMLTGIGLLLSVFTAIVIARGYLVIGGCLVLLAGIFDMFDGAMARVRQSATTFGAFLDSTIDRYSESIILLGMLLYAYWHPNLQDPLWPFQNEQMWMITFIYLSVVGSLMVSYTKARAEGLGIECKVGILARPERVILLALGLLTNTGIWALALLAVFSNVTAVERMIAVWHTIRQDSHARTHTEQPASNISGSYPTGTQGANSEREQDVRSIPSTVPPFGGGSQQD
ncbi:hypothetical protein KTH_29610 [Thermosporothrix hazakensis]|nr:hypothetical protein KTH_29610 [Thermosporothrix hazakensis]